MKRDDWMILSLTFLTGLAIGMYVYITAYKPTYEANDISETEAEAGEWSVVGKRVGGTDGSDYIQPSFRLLGNGEYTYLPGGSGEMSLEPVEGSLSRGEMVNLRFNESELAAYERGQRYLSFLLRCSSPPHWHRKSHCDRKFLYRYLVDLR